MKVPRTSIYVLQVCVHILMGLSTKWVGSHHIDEGRLKLKLGIPKMTFGPVATLVSNGAKKLRIIF